MTQGIPVALLVRSRVKSAGECDTFEERYRGELFRTKEGFYILYEERVEESAPVTKTMLKWNCPAGELTLVRRGGINARMRFVQGETIACEYIGPYGRLELRARTTRVQLSASSQRGELPLQIRLYYHLLQGAGVISENEIEIMGEETK